MGLDETIGQADFVTAHMPSTTETLGLLDAAAIAKMAQGVRIINTSRGGIIDEDALYAALETGHVAGASLEYSWKNLSPIVDSSPTPKWSPLHT